jgi:SAM-dependent methyltransferase
MPEQQTQREYWSGKVGHEWARHAESIDSMLASLTEAALQRGAFKPGERVLDIGCGGGATSLAIARQVGANGTVVGVDLSPQLLDVARNRAREAGLPVTFIEADAGATQFDERFDAAFSRFGVMFFDAPVQAFAHIRNAMRPGGRLALVCWRPMIENVWATTPIEAIRPMLKAPLTPPDPDAPGPYALADEAKVQRILREAGWRDVALTRWDGSVTIGGGGSLADAADFLLKIGPCARAIADQDLDAAEAKQRLIDRLTPLHDGNGVQLAAACWLVTASA